MTLLTGPSDPSGLLGRTESISYNPWLIRVEAVGYRTYLTSLAGNPPLPADRLTAPPLGLTFPPPPSVTIRLSPSTAAGAKGQSDRHPLDREESERGGRK